MANNPADKFSRDELIPLAIVGLAFEFPGEATSEERFWHMLCDGRCASTDFPRSRLNIDAFYHPDENRPSSIPLRGGHFCEEDLGAFDAPFFSITPGEAACMDPQHRRMLETSFHALEDAGIPIAKCSGSNTSVYTGCFTNDYLSILQQDYEAEQRQAVMGIAPSMLANRVSWFFNFKGTSMNLDTACSSSLVALHLASQDLRAGTTSMALVGGANYIYHPHFMKFMSDFNFLSRDSRCWSFDQRANGYARGEGIAVLVVKRLADALRDGDIIRAVIRNIGSNQDGRTPGITQPSGDSQVSLIKHTYQQANLDMAPTRFFEAHGTGTPVGDPVEANAIGTAFRDYRSVEDPLYIGAVKANIGHLEGCSGLAGVIKTILVLEKGAIPGIAGFKSLNNRINPHHLRLKFPTAVVPWPSALIRRACVNSFGFGGTNCLLILDDARSYLQLHGLHGYHRTQESPGPKCSNTDVTLNGEDIPLNIENSSHSRSKLLVWSAHDEASALKLSSAYRHFLAQNQPNIDDLAYHLAQRRSSLGWKAFAISDTSKDNNIRDVAFVDPVKAKDDIRIGLVFTGQGAQYLGMGRQLLAFSIFRRSLEVSDTFLKQFGCRWSVFDVIESRDQDEEQEALVNLPEYAQPLTTCLQIALVDLLTSFAITPSVVIGHSSGEIAAAYSAGALSHAAAVKVAYHRGVLSSSLASEVSGLTMMAAGLSKNQVMPYLHRLEDTIDKLDVSIGCINSPRSVTLTGDAAQLARLDKWLRDDAVFTRTLRVPIAYHSRFMDAISTEYAASLGGLERASGTVSVPMISSVTGDLVTADCLATPRYWTQNLTSPVDFEGAMLRLLAQTHKIQRKKLGRFPPLDLRVTHLLEIGPHSALRGPIRENIQAIGSAQKPTYLSSLIRHHDATRALLLAVGSLYCAGYPVDLAMANCLGDSPPRPAPENMPRYQFNHSQSYWQEGRLSANFRFREAARHDLLGTRSLDWNPQIAQWRNIMRLAEVPWIEDHAIGEDIVFPAAGMVVMAIEGCRELIKASALEYVRGFELNNVSFSHPISFPRGKDFVETQLTISTSSRLSSEETWCQFRLFVFENDNYVECSSGSIRAVTTDTHERDSSWPTSSEQSSGYLVPEDWIKQVSRACQDLEHQDLYSMSIDTGSGLRYGPTFQNIEHMRISGRGEVTAQVNTTSWKRSCSNSSTYSPSYIVHPTTLDGLAQLLPPTLAQMQKGLPPMVPVHADSIWIDCINPSLRQGQLHAAAKCRFRSHRGASADIAALGPGCGSPLIYLGGLETAFIGSTNAPEHHEPKLRTLCTRLTWKPDIDMLENEQLRLYCLQERPKQPPATVQIYHSLILAIMCFIKTALESSNQQKATIRPKHLEAYVRWMKYQLRRLKDGEAPVSQASVQQLLENITAREQLILEVNESSSEGHFFMEFGRNLSEILRGDVDALEVMFRDQLSERYYSEVIASDSHTYPVLRYMDLLSFKNPSMSILEVGAGTGGLTLRLLEALSSSGVKKWTRYDYTDISPKFFDQAREKFHKHLGQMQFHICDISKDPTSQSFKAGSYDLIIASHVLHATDDLDQSLRNVRQLLKPNGRLLLLETTQPDTIHVGFAFGLLKGWWSPLDHDKYRSPYSPCLTVEQWHQRLMRAGFTGVDVEIPGQENPQCQYTSIIISSAARAVALDDSNIGVTVALQLQDITVVVDEDIKAQCIVASHLQDQFCPSTFACKTQKIAEASQRSQPLELGSASTLTIFLLELDSIFLDGISEMNYHRLHSFLMISTNVLWVTRGKPDDPRHSLVEGMGRVLMSEDSSRKFATLRLHHDDNEDGRDSYQLSQIICKLAQRVIESSVENLEINYTVEQGRLIVMRITENFALDRTVSQAVMPHQMKECRLDGDIQLSLRQASPGHLNSVKLQWAEKETIAEEDNALLLNDDEILVQVRAIGLTFRDHLIVTGQLEQTGLGVECAGIVQTAGATSGARPGDRVCVLTCPTTASMIRVRKGAFSPIPSHMSFTEAASIPSALWMAYHALVHIARLQEGETVLIHNGASCVGQMSIQLARKLGARVLVTSSSASKRSILCDHLKVPETEILNMRSSDVRGSLVHQVYRETQGCGVDVVVGPLTDAANGDGAFLPCLARFGRLIDISLHGSNSNSQFHGVAKPAGALTKNRANVLRTCVNMVDLLRHKPSMAYQHFQQAVNIAFKEEFQTPQPHHVFGADKADTAFSHFLDRDVAGKRIIDLNPDIPVLAKVKTRPKYHFRSDATYVIAGGLGGLGRSVARWMADRGARHLVLLSRSGAHTPTAKALVSELEGRDVRVATPEIDIADATSLRCILEALKTTMPPVRGCIQATMVLRDSVFQKMTYDDWLAATRPKVAGSWNLHELLPLSLDFFVMLSSINGIFGGRAQANYASGNTYQDALARYRMACGQRAVSIDLGMMVGEGVVAENKDLLSSMRRIGHLMDIEKEDFIALLDHCCDPSLPLTDGGASSAQVLVGIETPSAILAKGIDLHHSIRRPLFRHLFRMGPGKDTQIDSTASQNPDTVDKTAQLRRAASEEEAVSLINMWFSAKVASILGLPETDIDPSKPIHTYGIDSLVAIDLKNWFSREIGAEIGVFMLMSNTPLYELSEAAAKKSQHRQNIVSQSE